MPPHRGRRNDRQPVPRPALRHRTRNLDTFAARQIRPPTHRRSDPDTDPDRLTEHASPGVGVKATPLRGPPFGPRLDPDTATTRPTPGGHGKKKGQPARPHGLTGPTPSGMTWGFVGERVTGIEPALSAW